MWVYNRCKTDSNGTFHAGAVVLQHHVEHERNGAKMVQPVMHACPPGLSLVPGENWSKAGGAKSLKVGGKVLRVVDLSSLDHDEAEEMIKHTADGPSLEALVEAGGNVGDLAADAIEQWGHGPKHGPRRVLETLAIGMGRAPKRWAS